MIKIDDYDQPIEAAKKIIYGLRPFECSETEKKFRAALGTSVEAVDMYSVPEIREIAEHLMAYVKGREAEENL